MSESEPGQRQLTMEVGLLFFLRNSDTSWDQMLREWIDNSLGAGARSIRIVRKGETLDVIDDGRGCDDLFIMESLARSGKREGNDASMYGMGGIMSQICAGDGSLVEVISVHKDKTSRIAIDFNECVRLGRYEPISFEERGTSAGKATGTTIRIHRAKRFKDAAKLAADLGHDYAAVLRRGRRITLEVNGKMYEIKPFKPPRFIDKVEHDFVHQGHHITGCTGLVAPGVTNPYKGWGMRWGYRIAMMVLAPAGPYLPNRIYGWLDLPKSWTNIKPTKDGFAIEDEELWDVIGRQCEELLRKADEQTNELELDDGTELASDLLSEAIGLGVKGKRGGAGEKGGSQTPTGDGTPHQNWAKTQPGDNPGTGKSSDRLKAPSRIRVVWDETLGETPFQIDVTGNRKKSMVVTLNKTMPHIYGFRTDPEKLAVLCGSKIAAMMHLDKSVGNMLPFLLREKYMDTYAEILARISATVGAIQSTT